MYPLGILSLEFLRLLTARTNKKNSSKASLFRALNIVLHRFWKMNIYNCIVMLSKFVFLSHITWNVFFLQSGIKLFKCPDAQRWQPFLLDNPFVSGYIGCMVPSISEYCDRVYICGCSSIFIPFFYNKPCL